MTDISYDSEAKMWRDSSQPPTFYALDWRGNGDPVKQTETTARLFYNDKDLIVRIEFDDVPMEARIAFSGDSEAEKHRRASAALVERERIIALLENWTGDFSKPDEYYENPICFAIALIKGENK